MNYLKIGAAAAALIVGFASYYWGPYKGQADNPVEQASEAIIAQHTGLDIDITPHE